MSTISLTVADRGSIHIENLNHPDDVYLYLDGGKMGHIVWNRTSTVTLNVWCCGVMFSFDPTSKMARSGIDWVISFNNWLGTL